MCINKPRPIYGVDELFGYKAVNKIEGKYYPAYTLPKHRDNRGFEIGVWYEALPERWSDNPYGFHATTLENAKSVVCGHEVVVLVKIEHELVWDFAENFYGDFRGRFQTILEQVPYREMLR